MAGILKTDKLILSALLPALLFLCSCKDSSPRSKNELLNIACNEAQVGNWKQAEVYCRTAVEQDPGDVTSLIMLALCQENGGKGDEALKNFTEAAKLAPNNFLAQYNLGRLLYQHGRYEDSLSHLRAAYELDPKDSSIILLMAQAEGRLKLISSIKYYKKLTMIEKFKNKAEPWNQMGIIYAEKHDTFNALNSFMKAYTISPDNYIIALNFARFLDFYMNSSQSRSKAIGMYRKYLNLSETNPAEKTTRIEVSKRIKALVKASR